MKQIINRKMYDTETARLVSSYDNGLPYNDFRHFEESMYKKKNGEFFLCGSGGPMTKYGHSCVDGTSSFGHAIVPLTVEEAKDWVESHANAMYEDVFGKVEE